MQRTVIPDMSLPDNRELHIERHGTGVVTLAILDREDEHRWSCTTVVLDKGQAHHLALVLEGQAVIV